MNDNIKELLLSPDYEDKKLGLEIARRLNIDPIELDEFQNNNLKSIPCFMMDDYLERSYNQGIPTRFIYYYYKWKEL